MTKNNYLKQVSDKESAIILDYAKVILDSNVQGDFCEFGCYRGDTSLLLEKLLESSNIPAADGSSPRLWIYDSFEGLPAKTTEDNSVAGDAFRAGELLVSKKEVIMRFKKAGLRVPRVRKGFFENLDASPESHDLPPAISFAFLDGDLYQSIKTSFQLVWPRLTDNSIVIVHDYNNPELPGVAKAVDEWLSSHPSASLEKRETLAIIS